MELTGPGALPRRNVAPLLAQVDGAVRLIRNAQRHPPVAVTTFASFASLRRLPRVPEFQKLHLASDISISAADQLADLDGPAIDLALRYGQRHQAPPRSTELSSDLLTAVASLALRDRRPVGTAAALAQHTLLEEIHARPSAEYLSWRHGLRLHAPPWLEPRGWVCLNLPRQQIQAALAGPGVALARLSRLALVRESLDRGKLVEPFGAAGRFASAFAYGLVRWPAQHQRPVLPAFENWLLTQPTLTRRAQTQQDPTP